MRKTSDRNVSLALTSFEYTTRVAKKQVIDFFSIVDFFGKLFTNSETGTKFPERLIEDIIDIKVVHHFINITFR
jgi:hypothetical protein